jgi:hypothetical protein
MNDPRQVAEKLLGAIDWHSPVSGYCQCPGMEQHTTHDGAKDCRVNVDGVPTVFCFHTTCLSAVADANRRLRQGLAGPWELALPSGRLLLSGQVLTSSGEIVTREQLERAAAGRRRTTEEQAVLATLAQVAERFKADLFERFAWPMAEILEDSPLAMAERDAEDQFKAWLRIWPADSVVWNGEVYSSGKPEHAAHFRPVAEWHAAGRPVAPFTCGSAFRAGSYSRSNENVSGYRFMVVESDTLGHDQVGAIFLFLNVRLHFTLHAIVDTAGKSLHGWFDAPRNATIEARVKTALTAFGCDPKLFTYSQPVRVPGALREGRLQRLIWVDRQC